ncbi:MAG TPA: DUF992 domain-containing protein [Xanthobacteraceae bacterium]|nr:DUF992 domain-containing protein [Xanthobacteraceae bacterium]
MGRYACTFAAATLIGAFAPSPASAQSAKVGTLDCDVSGGIGFIIGSRKEVTCMFTPTARGPREVYVGIMSRFGLDIGATGAGQVVWAVFADGVARRGTLAGIYSGASAAASLAVGLGANVLVGGAGRAVALQPLTVHAQTGLNVAAGVTELQLLPAR